MEDIRGGQFLSVEFLFEGFSFPFRDNFRFLAFASPILSSVNISSGHECRLRTGFARMAALSAIMRSSLLGRGGGGLYSPCS